MTVQGESLDPSVWGKSGATPPPGRVARRASGDDVVISTPAQRISTFAVVGLSIALILVAFFQNRSVVNDISAPGLDIQYRELAGAQTMLDQGYGPDASYASEHTWYNPMAIWLIAGLSRITGVAPALVIARSGPYINLVAPIALFGLVALLFDRFAALAAAAAFVFAVGTQFPFTYSASYSPWFAPENFAQAWMYLSIAAASRAFDLNRAPGWAVAAGGLLGATFLTHVAPALLGGVVCVLLAASEWQRSCRLRDCAGRLATVIGVAFLISGPFTVQILGHYRLAIVNQFPSQSPSDLLDLNELPGLFRELATIPVLLAVAALGFRATRRHDRSMEVVLALLTAVLLFLAGHYARLLIAKAGVSLPPVVPAYHYFFYLMAVVSIGTGLALRDLGTAIVRRLQGLSVEPSVSNSQSGLATTVLAIVLVLAFFPRYQQRVDFTTVRREMLAASQRFPSDVVEWIRGHSVPEDVFLCTDDASLYVVTPAGRKVVATNRYFSNLYVDWAARDSDRRRMFQRLELRDTEGFLALARKYGVRYILISEHPSADWLRASGMRGEDLPVIDAAKLETIPGFTVVFRNQRFEIVAVEESPELRRMPEVKLSSGEPLFRLERVVLQKVDFVQPFHAHNVRIANVSKRI